MLIPKFPYLMSNSVRLLHVKNLITVIILLSFPFPSLLCGKKKKKGSLAYLCFKVLMLHRTIITTVKSLCFLCSIR